jgi:endonuclease/exonuclease/phosphatase family metal-dependent hydrolase
MQSRRLFLLLLVLWVFSLQGQAQQLNIGTYNIRYDNAQDVGNLWVDRAPVVAALLRFHDFDIFGTQEGLKNQLDDISKALPQYARYGLGRNDGIDQGEHSAIFYKKDRFKLLNKGDFWLSQTPEKPSLGWDATCCNRICSWIQVQDLQTKKKFYFFNVHYDHQGVQARQESSKLILNKIREIAGKAPVILTGDFNGDHESTWYQELANSGLLKDTYRQVEYPYASNASFNSFGKQSGSKEIIDHIFVTDHFKVRKWGVLTDTYHGKFPSDHFPVMVKLDYAGEKKL